MATLVQASSSQACPVCSGANLPGSHYCCQCGAPFGPESAALAGQLRAVLKTEIKDQKVLEIETSQLIVSRISDWAKLFAFFTALPLAFLLGGLAIWGITKFTDINEKLTKAEARADALSATINEKLGNARTRADALSATSSQLDEKYTKLEQDAARYQALGRP